MIGVQPENPGANLLEDAHAAENVTRPDRTGEAVRRVVRETQRVRLVVERNDDEDGPKNLLLRDASLVVDVGKDRRFDEAATRQRRILRNAAADQKPALALTYLDVVENLLLVLPGDERTHFRVAIERIPELDARRFLRQGVQHPTVNGTFDEQARPCRADLSLIRERAEQRTVDRRVEIRIGEHDVRILAAQLDRHPLDRVGSSLDHETSGVDAAGKGNLVDARVGDERPAGGRTVASDDVDDPGGQVELLQQLGEHQRGHRGLLGRFEHRRASRRKRRRQLPGGHQDRVVPRNDLSDDTHRLADHHRQRIVGHFERLAVNLGREPAVILEAVRRIEDVELCFDDRFAHVARVRFGKGGCLRPDGLGNLEEQRAAFARGHARPGPFVEC